MTDDCSLHVSPVHTSNRSEEIRRVGGHGRGQHFCAHLLQLRQSWRVGRHRRGQHLCTRSPRQWVDVRRSAHIPPGDSRAVLEGTGIHAANLDATIYVVHGYHHRVCGVNVMLDRHVALGGPQGKLGETWKADLHPFLGFLDFCRRRF